MTFVHEDDGVIASGWYEDVAMTRTEPCMCGGSISVPADGERE